MIEVCNEKQFKVGDTVWWFDAWGNLRWGIIYGIEDGHALIREEGKGAKTGAKLGDCWESKEACLRAEARRAKLQTKEYEESITDVESLVRFLFEHDVHSEYKDYDAEAAARKRARELLGIEI